MSVTKILVQVCPILMAGCFSSLLGNSITWDLNSLYGINQRGFTSILTDARSHFERSPNDTVIIDIDSGRYEIGGNGSPGIDLEEGIRPGSQGRLIFQGAGMEKTILVFTEVRKDMINGRNVFRTEFRDMHMTRSVYTVTQGTVVSVAPGEIVLDLIGGFPSPLDLWLDWDQGRHLRRYTNSLTDPQVIQENNDQVPFGWRDGTGKKPELVQGNQWRFHLNQETKVLNNYKVGELVGVKSKHEGETFWILGGDDLVFRNIKWTHSTRGVARGGFNNLKVIGSRIERGAPINGHTPCLASPSGGPQMNQPSDKVSTGMRVEDFYCNSTGDDCVAFFNVGGGQVINSTLRNSFVNAIRVDPQAKNICVVETKIPNSPIMQYWSVEEALASGLIHDTCKTTNTSSTMPARFSSKNIILEQAKSLLTISAPSQIREVLLYNLDGQIIRRGSAKGNMAILNTEFLPQRVYLIQVGYPGSITPPDLVLPDPITQKSWNHLGNGLLN